MKKVLSLLVVAGMFTFVACGPSAEEKAAIEKAKQDSIAAVKQDSINKAVEAFKQDSIAKAVEAAKQDSIAKAEEAAKKGKKGGKKAKK